MAACFGFERPSRKIRSDVLVDGMILVAESTIRVVACAIIVDGCRVLVDDCKFRVDECTIHVNDGKLLATNFGNVVLYIVFGKFGCAPSLVSF
eukprot:15851714-Heterocapsa_arctica.AAC.1